VRLIVPINIFEKGIGMLQRLDDRINAHGVAMKLADRRALEKQAQHPQRMGAGRMGSKMGLEDTKFESEESEEEKEMTGGASPESRLTRLVGGGRKKKPSAKQIAEKHLEAHQLAHEAMGGAKHSEAFLQGGALSKHLRELHGDGFFDDFAKGFMSVIRPFASIAKPILAVVPHPAARAASAGLSALGLGKGKRKSELYGGNTDPITGATDIGRVANPPPSFARNTVGMGVRRHRVVESTGGEYADQVSTGLTGSGKKTRAKASEGDARKLRGAAVSRLMKEKGMTLGEASKHIKEHGF
jgi:hypothetical protein